MKKLIIKHNGVEIESNIGSQEEVVAWAKRNAGSGKYPEGFKMFIVDLELDGPLLLAGIRKLRQLEYPSLGDQMDALHKSRKGSKAELDSLDLAIEAVKAKYPKPLITEPAPEVEYTFPVEKEVV